MKEPHSIAVLLTLSLGGLVPQSAEASFGKWLRTEVAPALTGERPPHLHPNRVTIKSGGTKLFEVSSSGAHVSVPEVVQIRLGDDRAQIQVGKVTVQTHQLRKRLAQAGCVAKTGDIITCAPDVLLREAKRLDRDNESRIEAEAMRMYEQHLKEANKHTATLDLPAPTPTQVCFDNCPLEISTRASGETMIEWSESPTIRIGDAKLDSKALRKRLFDKGCTIGQRYLVCAPGVLDREVGSLIIEKHVQRR